jgi:hypothetical protein
MNNSIGSWFSGVDDFFDTAIHKGGHLAGLRDGYHYDSHGVPRPDSPYYINNPMGPNVYSGTTRFSDKDIAKIITASLPKSLPPFSGPTFGLSIGDGMMGRGGNFDITTFVTPGESIGNWGGFRVLVSKECEIIE